MAQKLDALGERIQQLAVNFSRDLDGIKCSVCDADAIQGTGLALYNEFVPVGGLGLDHVCDVGDGLPCYVSAGRRDDCQLLMQQALTWNNRNRKEGSKGVVSDLLVNLAQEENLGTAHRRGNCLV